VNERETHIYMARVYLAQARHSRRHSNWHAVLLKGGSEPEIDGQSVGYCSAGSTANGVVRMIKFHIERDMISLPYNREIEHVRPSSNKRLFHTGGHYFAAPADFNISDRGRRNLHIHCRHIPGFRECGDERRVYTGRCSAGSFTSVAFNSASYPQVISTHSVLERRAG
jgi:hypothetical protein